MDAAAEILDGARGRAFRDRDEFNRFKLEVVRRRGDGSVPSNADLLERVPAGERAAWLPLLRTKPTRTLSGVAIVAVQSSPEWCPHGTCTFCPGGPPTQSAKSYTGFEPAALRAGRNNFDPYAQTADRVRQLQATGHPTDKIDLILMGGTFPARDLDYQQWFVKRCYDAMNDAGAPSVNRFGTPGAATLDEAMAANESAANRCIGVTVETKPDWCMESHLDVALGFGATRIELGAQTLYDDVLARTHRGHTVADTVRSTRLVKDAGLKLVYHMMLGMPGNDPARDLAALRRLFEDEAFRPDMLKLYPTLVVPGTALWDEWRRGAYAPFDTGTAADVVAQAKRFVPEWVRIQRVDRDIPTTMVSAGVDKSNLREVALARLREVYGATCRCIRCREVGLARRTAVSTDPVDMRRVDYSASGGRETFLSLEEEDGTLHAYLRMRRPGPSHRPELSDGAVWVIRELKVHGQAVPIGARNGQASQHRGLGARLLEEAGRVAFDEDGADRLFVLSGVGVKPYYRRLGFRDAGAYVARGRDVTS